MTVGERLKELSGLSNATVGTMLRAIAAGATVGEILVNYSMLASGTVAEHLLSELRRFNYPVFCRKRNRR